MNRRELLKLERERSLKEAKRCADWRQKTLGRPESRVVDRCLIEGLWLALADRSIVPAGVAAAVMGRIAHDVPLGLIRLGYDDELSKSSLAGRIRYHAVGGEGSAVRPALVDVRQTGSVTLARPARKPIVVKPSDTPVMTTFTDTA